MTMWSFGKPPPPLWLDVVFWPTPSPPLIDNVVYRWSLSALRTHKDIVAITPLMIPVGTLKSSVASI